MMSENPSPCTSCGNPVPATAPMGLCPRCLIQAAAESAPTPAGPRSFEAPTLEALSELLPQFEFLSFLGQGGMGAVYKALHRKLDRLLAIKVLPRELAGDPSFEERFLREARAMARLQHPNLVGVHDFGEAGGLYYLALEFVDGPNLRQLLVEGKLEPGQALEIVPQICEALQYAHGDGVVHRDIKPENILLDESGRVRITDFGLARIASTGRPQPSLTGTDQAVGTPHYMAPEQLQRPDSVDHRADIFSLGVVFYEMLTGQLPLGKFPLPSAKSDVGERMDDVVLRSLEHEPEERYQQAAELRGDLERARSTSTDPNPTPPIGTGPLETPRRDSSVREEKAAPGRDARRLARWATVFASGGAILLLGSLLPWGDVSGSFGLPGGPLGGFGVGDWPLPAALSLSAFNGSVILFGLTIPNWVQFLFGGVMVGTGSWSRVTGVRPHITLFLVPVVVGAWLLLATAFVFLEGRGASPGLGLGVMAIGYALAIRATISWLRPAAKKSANRQPGTTRGGSRLSRKRRISSSARRRARRS